jgi:CheY-like chemotaxis protein
MYVFLLDEKLTPSAVGVSTVEPRADSSCCSPIGLFRGERYMSIALLHGADELRITPNQPARILVIDDDVSVGVAIQTILARRHCETVLASRARAGIQMLHLSRFHVVMVDIFMPGLSGLNTIEYIRKKTQVPIIAMSGFHLRNSAEAVDYLDMATQRGASLCMRKPFQPSQLIDAVERSVGLWRSIEG